MPEAWNCRSHFAAYDAYRLDVTANLEKEWAGRVATYLKRKGPTTLGVLGAACPRPKKSQRLKALLTKSDLFAVHDNVASLASN